MAEDIWTIKRMLDWCQEYLGKHGDSNPLLSAQWLLCGATGLERIELYTSYDKPLSPAEKDFMRDAVHRRAQHEPLQYIVGETEFRFIPVKVRPGVLIPRPETEMLAGQVIDWIRQEFPGQEKAHHMVPLGGLVGSAANSGKDGGEGVDAQAVDSSGVAVEGSEFQASNSDRDGAVASGGEQYWPLVVEIGCGSGCVSCAIAYEIPHVHVIATDISPVACQVTGENVANLSLESKVDVVQCDMGGTLDPALMGTIDVVVSNPPYIPTGVCKELDAEVRSYEPMLALDGGADGLDLARRLMGFAARALRPGGLLALELFEGHMNEAAELAREAGFAQVRILEDLTGRPRFLEAVQPE